VTNSDYKLKPGMTANVSIVIAQREDALVIPNGALRFRPPENAKLQTNTVEMQAAPATNSGNFSGGSGGHRGGGRGRGERQVFHTVYTLAGEGKNVKLQAVQIRTGISDGISTEVLSGLNEGDRVVTGTVSTGAATSAATSNPFGGGGMPRMR